MPQGLCAAGRGDHYIEHGGYTWRTLDGADPQGPQEDAPNHGSQCIGASSWGPNSGRSGARGQDNYLPLPAGWVLAPNDATSIAVVAAHGWSTPCAVLADGSAWGSANAPGICGHNLATSGGTYTVTDCDARVLARCG